MAINPSIALGVRGIEVANPLAQYGQIAAIQNAQNQNALAQFQLGSARRQEEAQNALSQAYQQSINPQTGKLDPDMLINNVAKSPAAHLLPDIQTKLLESQAKEATLKKTNVETAGLEFDQRIKKANKAISDIAALNTPQEAIASIDRHLASGDIDQQKADLLKGQITSAPSFGAWQTKMLTNILDAKGKLEQQRITTKDTDRGGYIERQTYDAQGLPVGAPIKLPKTATIGEQTAQGQLGLAKQKFAWEQANPGFELKEAEDGSIVGVNKRTLQAVPVTLGGASPAAAPVAGVGMPGERIPAIPGMTSVLDQQAPTTAPAAGVPLMGKGTAMTEAQSNAATFGGAMAQAQKTIKELEKSGTVKNAVVPGLLTGLAQMVPFGVGESIGNVIQSTFNADPTGLIGPNAAQQKLAQAQLAFATAYLRKTSGAAFGASEVANTIKEFFPLIGEGEKVIAQKAAARERAIEGMKISTNKEGKKYIEGYGGGNIPAAAGGGGIPGATATNPLGLSIPGVK